MQAPGSGYHRGETSRLRTKTCSFHLACYNASALGTDPKSWLLSACIQYSGYMHEGYLYRTAQNSFDGKPVHTHVYLVTSTISLAWLACPLVSRSRSITYNSTLTPSPVSHDPHVSASHSSKQDLPAGRGGGRIIRSRSAATGIATTFAAATAKQSAAVRVYGKPQNSR